MNKEYSEVFSGFKHEMLVANAGSGKTYILTTRIIRLLLANVPVDKIVALTFTRKSASEFLEQLLIRLAEAAVYPDKLSELAGATDYPSLTTKDCCKLLSHIFDHFHRLSFSTIDGFFVQILQQFRLECGLPEEFTIVDNVGLENLCEEALAECFSVRKDTRSVKSMVNQCRQISPLKADPKVFSTLLNEIQTLHQYYLKTPEGCIWGNAQTIWPGGTPFADASDVHLSVDAFRASVSETAPNLLQEARDYLEEQLNALCRFDTNQTWNKEIRNFISRILINEPRSNRLRLARKKEGWLELTPEIKTTRKALKEVLFAHSLKQFLERTKGLYKFVKQYELIYQERIRNAGRIGFIDVPYLLLQQIEEVNNLDWQTQVAYRIDRKFDHWLLDEFQDTSRIQWIILRTFIEEVLMDDTARRSFFYVGDTKQAIYSWRDGDARLFREILDDYQPSIKEATALTESWRSTQPVIDLVNQVFNNVDQVGPIVNLSDETIRKWQLGWNVHQVAQPVSDRVGYAAWHAVSPDSDDERSAQHLEVLRILQEVEPIKHNKECAVLLRKNQQVAELAALLESEGIPVAVEGKVNFCMDNFLGSAILAALRAVAHPGDTLSREIARGFTPNINWNLKDMDVFRIHTLQSIAEFGYAKTLRNWIELANFNSDKGHSSEHLGRNDEASPPDGELEADCLKSSNRPPQNEAFLSSRARALLAVAEAFDTVSGPAEGIDEFIAAIEAAEIQESEAKGVIRIMTVHQAKGLGFDMVIVCELDNVSRTRISEQFVLGPNQEDPQWGLLLPPKVIAEAEPVMQVEAKRIFAEAKMNELCIAYVALTRAKQAIYVISYQLGGKTTATHFGRYLELTLEKDWSSGEVNWFRSP